MQPQLKQSLIVAGLLLATAATVPSALAADAGWYFGISAGQSKFDASAGDLNNAIISAGATPSGTQVDDTDTGWKLFAGYQFTDYLAVEGGYVDLGKLKFSTTITNPALGAFNGEVKSEQGAFIDVVGTLPIAEKFSVFGKLGVYSIKAKASGSVGGFSFSSSDRSSDLNFGIGASYNFTRDFGLRAEWERFRKVGDENKTGEGDVDLLSVGLTWKFR